MTDRLSGKVALITGGARGQGRSHALTFASEGANIVICDIAAQIDGIGYPLASESELAATVDEVRALGRRCLGVQADVRDLPAMEKLAAQAIAEFGRIDVLVANAGTASYGPIAEMSAEQWHTVVDVNLTGVFNTFRAVLPYMIEQQYGRIVATASIVARMGATNAGHYAAAKWGVIGLVKSLALEVLKKGITVNAVLPSGVDTPMLDNPAMYKVFRPDLENPTREDAAAVFQQTGSIENLLQPAEVSEAILFLVSDTGRHMTGEALTISGGMSASTT
jgi:SDR family mycofactocin-dependent oxidoreductase